MKSILNTGSCSDNSRTNKDIKESDELAVLVSISGIVKNKTVEEVLNKEFDVISFEIDEPGLKKVLYKEDVVNIQAKIKDDIEKLLQQNDYKKIHLFYAGPTGLAIEIGRGINPNIWGEVCLYQYNNRMSPKYQYTLSI
ncbi:hypothetical protein CN300_01035 [Bacillus thuringiensis]|nr:MULTISPECIES: SAVED domain-containing protein [Bacillus]KXY56668.1 hypothetical protein AT261_18895 [Bacillus cereus]KAB2371896.1 SAVED domain-containing protein [Bacillus sp. RM2(2019)]MEB8804767.1 SAVED domain-containing protein [Bacillus cereus]PEC18825.1 hypothetical protein CON19_00395 [Bacillus thuringiensis]PEV04426.1 hypothetical protein CN418_30040 [Bacillus thuringiensis]